MYIFAFVNCIFSFSLCSSRATGSAAQRGLSMYEEYLLSRFLHADTGSESVLLQVSWVDPKVANLSMDLVDGIEIRIRGRVAEGMG